MSVVALPFLKRLEHMLDTHCPHWCMRASQTGEEEKRMCPFHNCMCVMPHRKWNICKKKFELDMFVHQFNTLLPIPTGTRRCTSCTNELKYDQFQRDWDQSDGFSQKCLECSYSFDIV